MKLNKKGYMLVEIVVASVLAISIAYYLLNLTYKFKNTNEDLYQSYLYTQDKLLITKNIMSDLDKATVSSVVEDLPNNIIDFTIVIPDGDGGIKEETRRLQLQKENNISKIIYGKTDKNNIFIKNDISYYEKILNSSLIVTKLNIIEESDSLTIEIPIESIYSNNTYSIKIFANKTQKEHHIDLGIIIDGALNLDNDNVKVKLKTNNEIYKNKEDEEYVNYLCDNLPHDTKIEILEIQHNGVIIEDFTPINYTLIKDTSIRLNFSTTDNKLNIEQKDYDLNNDICKNINS